MGLIDGITFEQKFGNDILEKDIHAKCHSKYLVRPNDMMIFEIDESNGCYRPEFDKDMKNRPNASNYFTYEILTQNYHFFPIEEDQFEIYKYFEDLYSKFISWKYRPDGHGGAKGGTFSEFMKMRNIK